MTTSAAIPLSPTPRSTVRRGRRRAVSDRAQLHRILDENVLCHLGVIVDGSPRVIPTCYGRDGETLYLHGSVGARSLRTETEICVTVSHVHAIVYARAAMHFSANYDSATIHGRPRVVADKITGLRVITEALAPGSWNYVRPPDERELAQTTVLALDLREASVKIRAADPADEPRDLTSPVWAGVLPMTTTFAAPRCSADLNGDVAPPPHVRDRIHPHSATNTKGAAVNQ